MIPLFKIIKKNLKLLIRSKTSGLVVILAPLLLIFLVGMAFDNSNVYRVNIGVYSGEYDNLTESFLDKLTDNNFRVTKTFSERDCLEEMRQGRLHTCIVFSQNFTIGGGVTNDIIFYVDYSKINLVYMILDTVSAGISERSSEISTALTDILLGKIEDTKAELEGNKPVLVELTNANNQLVKEIATVKQKLEGLNLDMDVEDFKLESVRSDTEVVTNLTGFVLIHYDAVVSKVRAAVAAAVKGSNASSNATGKVTSLLTETRLKLANINEKLSNKSINIDNAMADIDDGLNQVKGQLDKAGLARTEIFEEFQVMQGVLTENLKNILNLQNSVDNMLANLGSIVFTESEDITNPVTTTIKPIVSQTTNLNYIFPSLIALVIMFISLLLSSTLVVMEKNSKAYFRNFITPTRDVVFVLATYLTSVFLLLLQLVIILVVSAYFFRAEIVANLPLTALILFLVASMFILAGMLIGYLFNSEETSTLASISLGSIFLLMSNVLLPLESMPPSIQELSKYNPFVLSQTLLEKSILFTTPISTIADKLYLIAGYVVGLFLLVLIVQKLMKRNFLAKYARKLAPIRQKKK